LPYCSRKYVASFDELLSWALWAAMAAWHLPGGPVGPPARWAATSNVEEGVERRRELRGP